MIHTLPCRVYYGDTDAGGVMYHGTHLDYAERARTELLRHLGYQSSALAEEHGFVFLVRHLDIDYIAPAFLDDLLEMHSCVIDMKNTSFVMKQVLKRGDETISAMNVVVVAVDLSTKKPIKIPEAIRLGFERYKEDKE